MKTEMAELEMLSVVALVEELPQKGLGRGQVGTIVERLAPGVYEVEFSDDNGRAYASAALPAEKLMRLYHEPKYHAA
jgi:hypothetical protein